MISIICNTKKEGPRLLPKLFSEIKKLKRTYTLIESFPFTKKDKDNIYNSTLTIILGGDGTVLSTLSQLKNIQEIPIIPVHYGTLGFVSSVTTSELFPLIKNFLKEENRDPQ